MKDKCIICNIQAKFLLNKAGYRLFKCDKCGLVFVNPQPSVEQLEKEVYSESAKYQAGKNDDLSVLPENYNYLKILNFLDKREKGKLLDVGCSSGEFIFLAKKRGHQVYGVELNPLTAKIAQKNNLNVTIGFIENAKYKKLFFDYIFLGDLIEHLKDPQEVIRQCKKILKKDGLLIVSTPNLDCFWAKTTFFCYKLLGIPWSSVTPPYHLFQFSFDNMNKLLKKDEFVVFANWYNSPPPLSYELWFTEVPETYIKNKNVTNLLKYVMVKGIYSILYYLNKGVAQIDKKDNGMLVIYNNK